MCVCVLGGGGGEGVHSTADNAEKSNVPDCQLQDRAPERLLPNSLSLQQQPQQNKNQKNSEPTAVLCPHCQTIQQKQKQCLCAVDNRP